jgi:tripartite-type tricarboxylate transporter receptor subunit TctC
MLRILAATLAAALLHAGAAAAQTYPQQPIRMIVPFAAGGGTDVLARIVAAGLAEQLKGQVVVENRGGAGSLVGTDAVAKAAPDGYTLLYTSVAAAINPAVYKKLPYAPGDLVAVAMAGSAPLVLVAHPSVPATNLKELIALFKANPKTYNYGSSGNGTTLHMAAELFRSMAGVEIVHVPYRGAAPAMTDLIGGRIALVFDQVSTAASLVAAGQLKGIAVTTKKRSELMPTVPTMDEAGLPGYEAYTWNVVMVPRGTPQPIVDALNKAIGEVTRSGGVRKRYSELGAETGEHLSPAATTKFVADETAKYTEVAKSAGVSIE